MFLWDVALLLGDLFWTFRYSVLYVSTLECRSRKLLQNEEHKLSIVTAIHLRTMGASFSQNVIFGTVTFILASRIDYNKFVA
jgi:hypothetical protein